MLEVERHVAGCLHRQIRVGPDVLRLEEVGGAVGPGSEVGPTGVTQPLLEDPADFPVLRVNVDDPRVAEVGDLLHHHVHGAVVDADAQTGATARPVAVLVLGHSPHPPRLQVQLERGDPMFLGVLGISWACWSVSNM